MKASDYIIALLKKHGTTKIFSLSGGMISHLEDSVFIDAGMQLISMKHEQAGAFAAEGYTRISGNSAVAMGTSGPGATNMITGIASAYFDSIPVLYITGQVNTNEITPEVSGVRQTGFQETKIIPIVTPITKYAVQIERIDDLRYELEKAYFLMHHGRKGPVVVDIPMNMQRAEVNPENMRSFYDSPEHRAILDAKKYDISPEILSHVKALIENAKRPVILVGGGIRLSGVSTKLQSFLGKSRIPVVASLMGIDAVSHDYPGYIGMIGSYGVRHANIVLTQSDLLIVLGSRLDIRQTGAKKSEFAHRARIIHVDIDESELGYTIPQTHLQVHAPLSHFFESLHTMDISYPDLTPWYKSITESKPLLPEYSSEKNGEYIHPNYFFHRLSELTDAGTIWVNDVGQNQMWSSQSLVLKNGDRLLNSGGLGSMGFSLPTAIGSCFASDIKSVISINGDGGFQMNIQELETISYHHLPVGVVVLNNKSLGMVREFQDTYFDGRNIGTVLGYSCPDLERIAYAYKMSYFCIEFPSDIDGVFASIREVKGPYVLEVMISNKAIVEPKILFGDSLDKQSPRLSEELENTIQQIFS